MDQGINLPFGTQGIEDASFGMPTFKDGWKGLIITGSSQKALASGTGGRLLLHIKCVHDPDNVDTGKVHILSLNLWHPDSNVADRAKQEMASIMRAINNGVDMQINNTAELYNRPFMALAATQKPAPTPQYPNPQDQTNWRGYATQNGLGINCDGPAGKAGASGGGAGGGFGGAGGPPNFNQQQQGQPQAGNQQGGQQGWNQQGQPQGQPQQGWNQNNNGNNGNGNNAGNNGGGWDQGGSNAQNGGGAPPQNNAQNGGGWGNTGGQNAPTQSPSNQQQGGGWQQPQGGGQPQQGQPQQQQNGGGSWGNNQQGGGSGAPWG